MNKKERRRLSLSRPFTGDYMNYRENFLLKVLLLINCIAHTKFR